MEPIVSYDEHPAMLRDSPPRFLLCLILVPLLGTGALMLGAWYLGTRAVRLQIEGGELRLERGLLSKSYTELTVSRIRSVRVEQTFFQRILETGDIKVFTSGDDPELVVRGMPRPWEVRELVRAGSPKEKTQHNEA